MTESAHATKLAYLAKRNPALSVPEFAARWRQHSLLAGSMPAIRPGIAQTAHCLNLYDRSVFARATLEYDGVNFLTLTDPGVALTMWQPDEAMELLQPDELETFSTYARHFTLTTHEHVVSEGKMQHYCLIFFLKRDRGFTLEAFTRALAEAHGVMADGARRAVVNAVFDRPPGYNFDAVTELWFESEDEVREFTRARTFADAYLGRRAELCDEMRTVAMMTKLNHARPPIDERTAAEYRPG
ncbi:hypothetical protein [Amycolatopsis sp. NPDC051372]|uniref:hypothetical protein n=1 Tax=Amycolatopsis sp. NPDC051372 TaxID=3155669 RepID=UPI0034395BB3